MADLGVVEPPLWLGRSTPIPLWACTLARALLHLLTLPATAGHALKSVASPGRQQAFADRTTHVRLPNEPVTTRGARQFVGIVH